jgi:hypothetical protein
MPFGRVGAVDGIEWQPIPELLTPQLPPTSTMSLKHTAFDIQLTRQAAGTLNKRQHPFPGMLSSVWRVVEVFMKAVSSYKG